MTIDELALDLPELGAIMGLDPGTKTIGVAVSDSLRSVATPLETIRRRRFREDAARLEQIAADRDIKAIVVGLPVNMVGTEGPRAQSARAFGRNLRLALDRPVAFWDERLSTVAAERALLAADASRARRSQVIDHVAASFILQGALDRLRVIGSDA